MTSWLKALDRTRQQVSSALTRLFGRGGALDDAGCEELENRLLQADIPARLVHEIIETLRRSGGGDKGLALARERLLDVLGPPESVVLGGEPRPQVILIVGINGSGKTTTSAKLAALAKRQGQQAVLGAADTFRAAGSSQLKVWADRVGCAVVTGAMGADAAAVAYDALDAAMARQADVVIVDTAGRMHTKLPLMDELEKCVRAVGKRMPGAPHHTWIVLDATMGQNAILQAQAFHARTPLTGVIVSKLDGSSKAGFLFAVRRELGIPVRYAGLGEGADDLVPFDPPAFVDALLGLSAPEGKRIG